MSRGSGASKMTGLAASLALLLASCGDGPQQEVRATPQHRHVSPARVDPPVFPPGSFDQEIARAELSQAKAARLAGNGAEGRRLAEAAVRHWPGDAAAWEELHSNCILLKDDGCRQTAGFFLAKLDYVSSLPAEVAVLGFQTIAEEPIGAKASTGLIYDRQSIDMARRLWAFYYRQEAANAPPAAPAEQSFSQEYPYGASLIAIGIGAGVLTAVKSLANK